MQEVLQIDFQTILAYVITNFLKKIAHELLEKAKKNLLCNEGQSILKKFWGYSSVQIAAGGLISSGVTGSAALAAQIAFKF